MADNLVISSSTNQKVATREVTYSGDASTHMETVALALVSGSDDAKTATDIIDTAPLPTRGGKLTPVTASWTSGTSANTRAEIACEGFATVVIRLVGGSLVNGALSLQRSEDGGSAGGNTWHVATDAIKESIGATFAGGGSATAQIYQSISGNTIGSQTWEIRVPVAGFTHFAVILTSVISSGTLDIRLTGSAVPSIVRAFILPDYATNNPIPVSGSVTVVATATSIGKNEDDASANGDTGVPAMAIRKATPADTSGTDGDYEILQMKSGRVWASADITIGGTAVDGNSGNKSAQTQRVVIATDQPNLTTALNTQGDVAHGSSNSGSPIQNGFEAIAHGSNPTAVTAGQRTKAYANRAGIPFVMGGHPNVVTIEVATTGAQTDAAIVTVGAGAKIVVTQIQIITDNANTAFPQIRVGFGTANTPTTTGVVATHPGLPAGGGISRGDGSGIIGVGADNEDLRYTCGAPTGGSIRILVTYYTIES